MSVPGTPPEPPFRATDSPWFWGCVFAVMGLVGIAMIAPKFSRRQGQLERRFLGRQQAAIERNRRAAGLPPVDLADAALEPADFGADEDGAGGAAPIVPLWTLATAAAGVAVGSGVMLAREATRGRRPRASRRRRTRRPAGTHTISR
jgi:hypothetical protein